MITTSLILLVFLTFWDSITLSQAQCNTQDLTCGGCIDATGPYHCYPSEITYPTISGGVADCCCQSEADCITDRTFDAGGLKILITGNLACLSLAANGTKGCRYCSSNLDCLSGVCDLVTDPVGGFCAPAPPTTNPSGSPSENPTSDPTVSPSQSPETSGPSKSPSLSPSRSPETSSPSKSPSLSPTSDPTVLPSQSPNLTPSLSPATSSPTTSDPTVSPSQSSTTDSPTTKAPTDTPTINPSPVPSDSVLPTTTTKKPTISPSNFPSLAPTPLDPSVDSTSNSTGTLDTGNSTNTTAVISPLARYLRELQEFSCASDEVIDALDKTTFAIVASALEDEPSQEVTGVKTKECTKDGPVITYVQEVNIKVLCGSDSCEDTAAELEDNPPATVIAKVINEAIENGSFVSNLQAKAAETCDKDCSELEGATAKPVAVMAGPLVINTLSPSVSPTSSSPMTKSPVMTDSPTDNSAAPTSSTSTKNKGSKSGKKGGTKAMKSAKSSLDSETGSSKADDKSKESSKSSKSTKIEEKDEPETEESIKVNEENERVESIKVEDIEDEDTKEDDTKNNSILDSFIEAIIGYLN